MTPNQLHLYYTVQKTTDKLIVFDRKCEISNP